MLIFSLPFCLLLPDDIYQVNLGENDIVTLKLSKVIPKTYDERLPFRGFLKGELENISRLKIFNPKSGFGGWIEKNQLNEIKDKIIVNEYETLDGVKIVPTVSNSTIDKDLNWDADIQQLALEELKKKGVDPDDEFFDDEIDIRNIFKSGRRLILNCEINRDRYGRCRYTRIIYESSKLVHYEKEFPRAVRAINILVSLYRLSTNSHWITKVSQREFFYYKTFDVNESNHGWNEIGQSDYAQDHDNQIVDNLKKTLLDTKTRELYSRVPFFQLRLDAKNAFDETNYHLSIIYIITALESLVKLLLSYYYSKKKMKKIERLSIWILVSKTLKTIFPFYQLVIYLEDIWEALKVRNRIIHKSDIEVEKESCLKILSNVDSFIKFLLKQLLITTRVSS